MTAPFPSILDLIKAGVLALIAMIFWPVLWGMRLIGRTGAWLSAWKAK